ncbi:MAG: TetR/AcrR family transcriptional regulator [Pauljensenia sp.]|jgi:Transcriptional regulator
MKSVQMRRRIRMPAEQRREQLLAAATSLIAEYGFWALSLQDVADACDLSLTGLLHHFPSKDALLIAVLARRDRIDAQTLSEVLGLPASPERSGDSPLLDLGHVDLRTACIALVARNARQPELVRLYTILEAESLAPEHPAHSYFAARQESTLSILRDLVQDTENADLVARQVLALMDGLQVQWLRDPDMDIEAVWQDASTRLLPKG